MKSKPQTLNDLKPNARNPRKISDERLEMLRKSLVEFGDLSGFVVSERTGTIISGHQRQKVLPAKSKIVVTRNYPKPTRTGTIEEGWIVADGESFAYRKVDWPKAKEQKALLAANQHGGEWDSEMLQELLKDMPDTDRLLAGFDDLEAKRLIEAWTVKGENKPSEEWDMEFKIEPKAHRTITVHFKTQNAVKEFVKLLGQNIGDRTKFLWFPK